MINFRTILFVLFVCLPTGALMANDKGAENISYEAFRIGRNLSEPDALARVIELATEPFQEFIPEDRDNERILKDYAIRLLGESPGADHVDVLIGQLSYRDPVTLKIPAVSALVEKGTNAVASLTAFVEAVTPRKDNAAAIYAAGLALENIFGREGFKEFIRKHEPDIDRNVLQLLVIRSAAIGGSRDPY